MTTRFGVAANDSSKPGESPRDHFRHSREVVHPHLAFDRELSVMRLLGHAVLEDDHRADVVLSHHGRDVEALDPNGQRLEVEHLPQLFERLHPPQPLELRLLGLGRECMTGVFGCKLLQSSLLPAFGCAHLHTRPSPFGEELGERGRFPGLPGHDDLRRDARRGAVVLDAERLDQRGRVLPGRVLEVEAVAVDQAPVPEREDLHGRAIALDGDPDHVDRSDRPLVGRLPLREVPN